MGSISPVIANYLAGQQSQQGIQEQAQNWALKKQQLDQALSEFDQNQKLEQQKVDIQHQLLSSNLAQHHAEAREALIKAVQSGQQPIPQIPGNPQQVSASTNVAGLQVPGISLPTTQNMPVGQNMTANDMYGNPQTFPRPQTNLEAQVAQQKAMLPGIIAAKQAEDVEDTKKYMATIGQKDLLDTQNKLDMANAHNSLMQTYYDNLIKTKDDATAMRLSVAQVQAAAEQNSALLKMGFGTPQMAAQNGNNYAAMARLGQLSPDMEKMMNPAEKIAFKNALASSGSVTLDPKTKAAADANLSSGASLMNDFAQLDQKYPAQPGTIGKVGNMLATLPGLGHFTDIGQEFSRIQANIANLAKQTGESPSMARSVALAKKAEAAQISPTDNPQVRQEKYLKLGDLILDVTQSQFQNLPQQQKIDNWKLEFQKPAIQNLMKNQAFQTALEGILKTGDYDPSLIGKK